MSVLDDFNDRYGSSIINCKFAPIIPSASIIQNKTRDPTNGVTIIGNIVPNINGPLIFLDIAFKLNAIMKPSNKTLGVTNKQYVKVNKRAL